MTKNNVGKLSSIEKALAILDLFSEQQPCMTLDELVEQTGYSKPTVFRMVRSFEKYGYLRKHQDGGKDKIYLGYTFLEKANILDTQIPLKEASQKACIELRDQTGLSVQLSIRDGYDAVYIAQYESLKPIRVYPQKGRRVPLYAAACPRVLLSYMTDKEMNEYLTTNQLHAFTQNTMIDNKLLLQEISTIRKNGYAISYGELYEGTVAIAVPIFDDALKVIAAISLIGLEQDFETVNMNEFISLLRQSSTKITEKFAYPNRPL